MNRFANAGPRPETAPMDVLAVAMKRRASEIALGFVNAGIWLHVIRLVIA